MAEKWTPPAFNNNATGWQYTTDPSGNRWQILTGGLYRNDEGVTTANPGQYSSGAGGSASANAFAVNGQAPQVAAPTTSAPVMGANRFAGALTKSDNRLNALLDNPDSIQQSAAYKFRVGQGMEALQRSMGAKGMLNSGNRLLDLTTYGQDMGSQEYDKQWGRLKGLYDTNAQGYVSDKNANTGAFSAESANWLGDRNANTAQFGQQANAFNGWIAANRQTPSRVGVAGGTSTGGGWPYGGAIGGGSGGGGVDWGAFNTQMKARQDEMDRY